MMSNTIRVCLVEGKHFRRCLVVKGKGKEMVGLGYFLLGPTRNFSPQNGEKTVGREFDLFIDQNAYVHLHMGFCPIRWHFFFFFLFWFQFQVFFFFFVLIFFSFAFLDLDIVSSFLFYFIFFLIS